jgi:hypothetical protein
MGIFDETFLPGAQRLSVDSRLCRRVDANARQVRMAASFLGGTSMYRLVILSCLAIRSVNWQGTALDFQVDGPVAVDYPVP